MMIEAFGEKKSIMKWVEDSRCSVSYSTIYHRIRNGWELEKSITEKSEGINSEGSKSKCLIGDQVREIILHIEDGKSVRELGKLYGVSYENISQIKRGKIWRRVTGGKPVIKKEKKIAAFGEDKTFAEWLKDERFEVCLALFKKRRKEGRSFEDSMRREFHGKKIIAFGETKTLSEWVKDKRCKVDKVGTLYHRMYMGLMNPEEAITTEKLVKHQINAFGEMKSANEWVKDKRCKIGYSTLLDRVANGWDYEEALTVNKKKRKNILIFGETKNWKEWSLDRRCMVSYEVLKSRIKHGWELERALTKKQGIEIFGEFKKLRQWVKDKRCQVSYRTLQNRIKNGWKPEKALIYRKMII